MNVNDLPRTIYSGMQTGGHVQGIAVDLRRGYVYYSFTTKLVKTDLKGNFIGSVSGLLGHLGCIDFCEADGRVYGSLEYKNDEIGKGILQMLGAQRCEKTAFYAAIFDVSRIVRADMDAERDGIMTAVYLKTVVDDCLGYDDLNGIQVKQRYGCCGIDGTSFGPRFGVSGGKNYLNICYGIYGDVNRTDNDCQVILHYDTAEWYKYERRLSQEDMHESGPEQPDAKYFVYTGNTCYGVQNLEYDGASGNWYMAVYRGKKPYFPNYPMYVIDGSKAPYEGEIPGRGGERGQLLTLLDGGIKDGVTGICGCNFEYGQTGIYSLDNGYFYISHNGGADGKFDSTVRLYRATGNPADPFELVP